MPSSGAERQRLFPLRPYSDLFFMKIHQEIGLCADPQLFEAKNGVKVVVTCG